MIVLLFFGPTYLGERISKLEPVLGILLHARERLNLGKCQMFTGEASVTLVSMSLTNVEGFQQCDVLFKLFFLCIIEGDII